jgi:hypothetical protein
MVLAVENTKEQDEFWLKIIIYSVLVSAFIPKIIITEGINIFLPELILGFSLFYKGFRQFIFHVEQRLLFLIFGFILIFSLFAQLELLDIGSIMRSIKELLYIPIIYWASKVSDVNKVLRIFVNCSIFALSINLIIYFINFTASSTIWDGFLSSGISNKGFRLSTFSVEQLQSLSHGIWGGYCVLSFLVGFYAYSRLLIKKKSFLILSILFFISIAITVSREAILIILIIFFCYIFFSKRKRRYKILIIIGIVGIILCAFVFFQEFPIVQKLLYTQTALEDSGTEGNVQIRINTWMTYFSFLGENPWFLFWGLGLSPDNFYEHIYRYAMGRSIVEVPESAFVYILAYGSLWAFLPFICLIIRCFIRVKKHCRLDLLKYYFLGIIIVNLLSGVSMFSDLLYAHLCLVYGLLILNKNGSTQNITYNSES